MAHLHLDQGRVYKLDDREFIAHEADPAPHEQRDDYDAESNGWILFTPEEWSTGSTADWEVQPDGRITFQGGTTGLTVNDLVATDRWY